MLVWFLLHLFTNRSNGKFSAFISPFAFFPLHIHYPLGYMQKRFNASAVYVDLKCRSLPTLHNNNLKLLNMQIYHLMISLPFCLQHQTILSGKNSIILVISTSSVSLSLQTSLMQTLDCQQCCSEEIGSQMCVSYAEAS